MPRGIRGYRRWLPGLVTFVVGGIIAFAAPYLYPVNRSDPGDVWGHLLAGVVFGLILAVVFTVTRSVVERA